MTRRLAFVHGLPAPQRADPSRAAARALDAAGRRHAGVAFVRRARGAARRSGCTRGPARVSLLRAGRRGARLPLTLDTGPTGPGRGASARVARALRGGG